MLLLPVAFTCLSGRQTDEIALPLKWAGKVEPAFFLCPWARNKRRAAPFLCIQQLNCAGGSYPKASEALQFFIAFTLWWDFNWSACFHFSFRYNKIPLVSQFNFASAPILQKQSSTSFQVLNGLPPVSLSVVIISAKSLQKEKKKLQLNWIKEAIFSFWVIFSIRALPCLTLPGFPHQGAHSGGH